MTLKDHDKTLSNRFLLVGIMTGMATFFLLCSNSVVLGQRTAEDLALELEGAANNLARIRATYVSRHGLTTPNSIKEEPELDSVTQI